MPPRVHTDKDIGVANLSLRNAINKYNDLLTDYYYENGLADLVQMDSGLPTIHPPFANFNKATGQVSIFLNGLYGEWSGPETMRDFHYTSEYEFLDSLKVIGVCEVNTSGAVL